ncbi:MAG: hypothetical protein ABR926_18510 [Streptosporangiaceae bacterium]
MIAAGGALLAAGSLAKMLTAARDQAGDGQPASRAGSAPDAAMDGAPDPDAEPQANRP